MTSTTSTKNASGPNFKAGQRESLAAQVWEADDTAPVAGDFLAERLHQRGFRRTPEWLLNVPVGGCIKTGTSGYTRIK